MALRARWLKGSAAGALSLGLLATTVGLTSAQTPSTANAFTFDWPVAQGAPLNEFNSNGTTFWGVDVEPLAFTQLNLTTSKPALAQSWKLSPNGRTLTVQLRANDKWSNGQPVTAQDVKDAWALMYIEGWVQGDDTAQVNVLGPRTVQFVRFPTPNVEWTKNVLAEGIVQPFAFQQAGLLPANVWTTIYASLYNGTNAAQKAAATKAQASLAKLAVKISAFKPKTDISDGPWYISSMNSAEQIWSRNPYFFNNKENHLSTVILRETSSAQVVFNWVTHGQITFATGAFPVNVKQAALRVPGEHLAFQNFAQFAGLSFNEHDYPYNMVQVRQALAYAINRTDVQKIAEPVTGTPSKYLTGMEDTQAQQWLPKSALNSLNPYNYNTAKAASLLKSVGFKKVGGAWMMPNGKPFTISIDVEAGYADYDEAASVIENELDGFGIPTKVYAENLAQYFTDQIDGDYAVSFQPLGGNNVVYPHAAFDWIYFAYDGWTIRNGTQPVRLPMGNVKGSSTVGPREFDIPTVLNVPGVGRIEPAVVTQDLYSITSHAGQVAALTKLAKTTNYWMPVLPLFNQTQALFYNTTQFTDFPGPNSPLQNLNNVFQSFVYWAQYGYIRPVK